MSDTGPQPAAVADALARAVRALGTRLADAPTQVRGSLSDELGAAARSNRGLVDAVVIATEEGIAPALLLGEVDGPGAVARLAERGLGAELAASAVACWTQALGLDLVSTSSPPPPPAPSPAAPPLPQPSVPPVPTAPEAATSAEATPPGPDGASRRGWLVAAAIAVVAVLGVGIAVLAGGEDDSKGGDDERAGSPARPAGTRTQRTTTTTTRPVPDGGTLVVAMEQEPFCFDWMALLCNDRATWWTVVLATMPRAFDVAWDGRTVTYAPSPLLRAEPTVQPDEGGPGFTVTYDIDPAAVWSDGTPITAADFAYTWEQMVNGAEVTMDAAGYRDIDRVDAPRPDRAVVHFTSSFARWRSLFGGEIGIFPSHVLRTADRHATLESTPLTVSGGPWVVESWVPGDALTLGRNPAWWGRPAHLERVVFKPIGELDAQLAAIGAGSAQIAVIDGTVDAAAAVAAGRPAGTQLDVQADSGVIEVLGFNRQAAPFDSVAFRRAVSYAIDRDAVVTEAYRSLGLTAAPQSLLGRFLGPLTDPEAFGRYRPSPSKVGELMASDGWAKGADGIWAKEGTRASFSILVSDQPGRVQLARLVAAQLVAAGFEVTVDPKGPTDVFGTLLPEGQFQAAIWIEGWAMPEPALCFSYCSDRIADLTNWTRTDLGAEGDAALSGIDSTLDPVERSTLAKTAMNLLARDAVGLPVAARPSVLVRADAVVGPISINPVLGPFWNLAEWGLAA